MEFAGMFKDDPWIDDWETTVEEYRRKVNGTRRAMSLYVLDTDTLQLLQDENPTVVARVSKTGRSAGPVSDQGRIHNAKHGLGRGRGRLSQHYNLLIQQAEAAGEDPS